MVGGANQWGTLHDTEPAGNAFNLETGKLIRVQVFGNIEVFPGRLQVLPNGQDLAANISQIIHALN